MRHMCRYTLYLAALPGRLTASDTDLRPWILRAHREAPHASSRRPRARRPSQRRRPRRVGARRPLTCCAATAMAPATVYARHVQDRQLEQLATLVDRMIGALRSQRTLGSRFDQDDLHSVGMLAGWRALQAFNPDKGATWTTYARQRIIGGLLDYQREQMKGNGYSRHRGRVAHIVSFEQPIPDDGGDDLFLADTIGDGIDYAARSDDRVDAERILAAVPHLHPRDQTLVAGYLMDMTNAAIGDVLGVCESRVSQIGRDLGDRVTKVMKRAA